MTETLHSASRRIKAGGNLDSVRPPRLGQKSDEPDRVRAIDPRGNRGGRHGRLHDLPQPGCAGLGNPNIELRVHGRWD